MTSSLIPSTKWEIYRTCRTWDEADNYRLGIARSSTAEIRIIYKCFVYIVEFRNSTDRPTGRRRKA